jgi:hypothetical protein
MFEVVFLVDNFLIVEDDVAVFIKYPELSYVKVGDKVDEYEFEKHSIQEALIISNVRDDVIKFFTDKDMPELLV